jgi:hypothetical protein
MTVDGISRRVREARSSPGAEDGQGTSEGGYLAGPGRPRGHCCTGLSRVGQLGNAAQLPSGPGSYAPVFGGAGGNRGFMPGKLGRGTDHL